MSRPQAVARWRQLCHEHPELAEIAVVLRFETPPPLVPAEQALAELRMLHPSAGVHTRMLAHALAAVDEAPPEGYPRPMFLVDGEGRTA